ncbi:MAG: TlyA family RNA methyltransferase [Mycoplasmataceae bacterium]|nr:TlyA family RNA methyltransferase [Mycoplasmataceae bacterium]
MTLLQKMLEMKYEEKVANSLIKIGNVFVNDQKIVMPQTKIKETDIINVKEKNKYVSRGAYKLLAALEEFNVNPKDLVCLDIGSSTGGFTQVLLEKGAKFVYAVDVGTNQLDYKLRIDKRVKTLEKTNLKLINEKMFDQKIDLVVCDVSFISIKKVFDVISDILQPGSFFIGLIKPQYEVNSDEVSKGGIAKIELHKSIIDKIIKYGETHFDFIKLINSPILGHKSKNIEYLSMFKRTKNE